MAVSCLENARRPGIETGWTGSGAGPLPGPHTRCFNEFKKASKKMSVLGMAIWNPFPPFFRAFSIDNLSRIA
jgi:hypothetical protein